ncbi:MAG: hypothetical protein GX765_03435 [Candidatus Moranbacteria bacterium]|nr:hypothetical protein [Candidatus Moranbacteria bacterium]
MAIKKTLLWFGQWTKDFFWSRQKMKASCSGITENSQAGGFFHRGMRWLGQEVQSPRLKCSTDSNRLWFKSILLMLLPEKSLCWIQKFNPSTTLSVKGLQQECQN